ncbi:MAG: thioredoxin domain-containing protein [Patescibacteria group bacterium]
MSDGIFSKLSPKGGFFAGLGAALTLFFVVGFFVLLAMVLKDDKPVAVAPSDSVVAGDTAPKNIQIEPIGDEDYVKGNKNASISIIEFSDLECPFCKQFHPSLEQLVREYPNDVKWAYRHYDTGLHSKMVKEAEAIECAGEIGGNDKFWEFITKIFEVSPTNDGLDLAELPKIAKAIGLNEGKFNTCLNSGKYASKVQSHTAAAQAAGAQGTPYAVILAGDQKIPVGGAVPYSQLKSFVDSVLNK